MYLLTGSVLMKKLGYTLAELLITLGIIGGISALIIPAIVSSMPDENKTMYLKTYDTLSETIQALASNSQIYPVCDENNNINCVEHPLLNSHLPLVSPLKDDARYSNKVKLCNLLALGFGVSTGNTACSTSTYNYADSTFRNSLSFTTTNGMQWRVMPQEYDVSNNRANFQTDIYVDINGNKGDNCMYSNNCKKPDRFKFMVAANGEVVPADPMGRRYIATRKSLLKKNYSIADATIWNSLDNYKSGLRSFSYSSCAGVAVDNDPLGNLFDPPVSFDNDPERCKTPAAINGKPVVRTDGYVYNLKMTNVAGVFSEWYNSDAGSCTNYSNQKHWMWNPDTERFELLSGVTQVFNANSLANNEVYQRLKDKSSSPISYNGIEFKIPEFDGTGALGEDGSYLSSKPDIRRPK